MKPAAKKMLAEVLARQMGIQAGEFDAVAGDDPLSAILTLSMMNRTQPKPQRQPVDAATTLAQIAGLVGACSLCLGEDSTCSACAGRGRPASCAPDRAALLEWITPPLQRLGLCVSTLRRGRPEHDDSGVHNR